MKPSHFSKDIQEFICLLSKYKVRYVIVGGEAVIYYGYARFTGDVDFFYDTSAENVENLYIALVEFWQGDIPGISKSSELRGNNNIIMFGRPPNRLDLISSVSGISFQEAWDSKVIEKIQIKGTQCSVYFIGLQALIKNKETTG